MIDRKDSQSVVIVSQHYPPDKSGNASRIHDTAKHLVTEGWDVTVLAPPPAFPHGQFDRSWSRKMTRENDGVTVHNLWAWQPTEEDPGFVSRMAYYLLFPLHALIWLLLNHRGVDAIITSSPPIFTGITGLPFGLFSSTSWLVDVRDLWIDASVGLGFIEEGGLAERISRRYESWVLSTADRITVTTSVLGDKLAEQYGLDRDIIVHLPNGVDTDEFEPTGSVSEPTIVYTGNVGHAQDLESCIRAMSRIDHPDAKLKIVGDGDIKGDLEKLVQEEGLNESVEFTGLVERQEVPKILDEAIIGIAPLKSDESLEYAVPTKAYEYMSYELPVVTTGIGEIETLVEQSGGGYHVANDPDAIASAFETLLADDEKRAEFGTNSRQHMIERYDRGVVAKKLSATLQEVGAA
ncbi:glycosyltransferase family 4 protein [Haloglomus halophilum]|uniref:glycosyltransferase family 4 protein n=1 Tax=Haloglomus halophilum TaxID=2962672 RepID=UPI0020C96F3F|nr:glycosyltransferase family 4 protein [Haloglomus halophilum]